MNLFENLSNKSYIWIEILIKFEKYMSEIKLGFLASHGGSNMQSIIDECKLGKVNATPACVISNNSSSMALQRAEKESIPAYHISSTKYPTQDELDDAIIAAFKDHGVNIIILAGYMKYLSPKVIKAFDGKVLNIHPALLPKYGGKGMYGKRVHEAVLADKETYSGPTVHLVDEHYDHGRILGQSKVPVLPQDTVDTLAARVLEQEHILYPDVIRRIASGEIEL
jgi:phosphoribosylglycinamide formyltransferase-1